MTGQVWEVVGGQEQGGILVREGVALTSQQASKRLATGSRVRELVREGDRLRFERLSGDGPAEGWVSLRIKGKDLLVHAKAEEGTPAGEATTAPTRPDVPSPAGSGDWDPDQLFGRYEKGQLDAQIAEYKKLLCELCLGPEVGDRRASGVGTPWEGFVPTADPAGKPRLLLAGDSITHGPPFCLTSPYAWAVAKRNPSLFVENGGWGGAMSFTLADPQRFKIALPAPGEYKAQYVCVLIGTNDAMAMSATEERVDGMYVESGRLPADWRNSCPPSPERYERSLAEILRKHRAAGATRIAVATPPPLGEDTTDDIPSRARSQLRRSPYKVVSELAEVVKRVAAAEGCDVIPLFECAVHRLKKLSRTPILWTPQAFGVRMMAGTNARMEEATKKLKPRTLGEFGAENGRPELCFDLVHFAEDGAALYATLVQAWLDSAVAA